MDKKHRNSDSNHQCGFTLIELIITMAIATILVSIAIPNFSTLIQNNRITASANEFIGNMQLARSTAIKQQRNTTICVSTTFNANPPTCTGGTNWAAGAVVWVDQDRDNVLDAAEVVRVIDPINPTAAANLTLTSAAQSQFQYSSTGLLTSPADTLTLCDNRTAEIGRALAVSPAGRVNISNNNCP